jgi:hypothetical protein
VAFFFFVTFFLVAFFLRLTFRFAAFFFVAFFLAAFFLDAFFFLLAAILPPPSASVLDRHLQASHVLNLKQSKPFNTLVKL